MDHGVFRGQGREPLDTAAASGRALWAGGRRGGRGHPPVRLLRCGREPLRRRAHLHRDAALGVPVDVGRNAADLSVGARRRRDPRPGAPRQGRHRRAHRDGRRRGAAAAPLRRRQAHPRPVRQRALRLRGRGRTRGAARRDPLGAGPHAEHHRLRLRDFPRSRRADRLGRGRHHRKRPDRPPRRRRLPVGADRPDPQLRRLGHHHPALPVAHADRRADDGRAARRRRRRAARPLPHQPPLEGKFEIHRAALRQRRRVGAVV